MDFLLRQHELTIFVALFGALCIAEQVGFRLGRRAYTESDEAFRSHVLGLQAAVLGLLGLLLGFSFSMATERFDGRRSLVVEESNAIGTAILRTVFLEEPERTQLRDLLVRYVDLRVSFYDVSNDDPQRHAVDRQSERIHAEGWRLVAASASRQPTPTAALTAAAMNEVIDLHSERVAALQNHVPAIVLWLLFVLAAFASGLTGYASGVGPRRHWAPSAIVLLLIATVCVAIIDLDRPQRGLIRTGQNSMLDLQRGLRTVER